MKISLFNFILTLFISSTAYSQSSFIYFKAVEAYVTIGNDRDLQGPAECDDIVLINPEQNEITFLSTTARVYSIISKKLKITPNNQPYTEYHAKDRQGSEVIVSICKLINSPKLYTRVTYINIDGTGLMDLDGNVGKVF